MAEYDFGFSFEDDPQDEIANTTIRLNEKIKAENRYRDALHALNTRVQKFLTNLQREPEKAVIRWPGRDEQIKKFKEELDKIVEGANNNG